MDSQVVEKHIIEDNFLRTLISDKDLHLSGGKDSTDRITDFVTSFLNEHIEATKHRKRCLRTVFEMFLVFIYHGKRFLDFVSLLKDKAIIFVEEELVNSSRMNWFNSLSTDDKRNLKKRFKNNVYKFLFEMVSGVYAIFKDVRILKTGDLFDKYPFLSSTGEKSKKALVNISSLFSAEDVFLVGLSRVANSSNEIYKPEQLIPAIKNDHVIAFFKNNDDTSAFQSIIEYLPNLNGTYTLSQAVQKQIKWIMREYLDTQNPFTKECTIVTTNTEVPIPKSIVDSESHEGMNDPISVIKAAVHFFQKTDITIQEIKNAVQQKARGMVIFDFNENDYLTNPSEYLIFKSSNLVQSIVGGTLSLLLHAVRLLYLQDIVDATSVFHFTSQLLLNKLAKKDSINLVEAANHLQLDSYLKCERLEYSAVIRQFLLQHKSKQFIQLGSVEMATSTTDIIFSNSVKELLGNLQKIDANVFFLNVSGTVNLNGSLPRILTYKYNDDDERLDLVLFGSVYYSDDDRKYQFQFVSFSTKHHLGKHCVVTFSDGNSQTVNPLSYRKDKEAKDVNRVFLKIRGSYKLVGLILMRSKSFLDIIYPPADTIWRIRSESPFVNHGLTLAITTKCLIELGSTGFGGWLSSPTIQAFLILLTNYFKNISTHATSRNVVLDDELYASFNFESKYKASEGDQTVNIRYTQRTLSGVPADSVVHFPINTDNTHWRYSCADLCKKHIYLMNSYGHNSSEVQNRLIACFKGIYGGKWVCSSLECPYQPDAYNCGIYTIMNIAYVVQSIEQTQTTDVLTDRTLSIQWGQRDIPCQQIREMLSDKFKKRNTYIGDILDLVKL